MRRRWPVRRVGGGPWTPARLAGLQHWYRGDDAVVVGGAVERLVDRAGGVDAVQATAATRPLYGDPLPELGQPGGDFYSAQGHWLRATPIAALSQPLSIAVSFTVAALPGSQAAICGAAATAGGGGRFFVRVLSTGEIEVHAGGGGARTSTISTGTAYAGIVVLNGTQSRVRLNGSSVYAGVTDIGQNAVGEVMLGREGFADHHDGEIAELLVVAGDVTADAAALADLEAYMAERYL